MSKKCSACGAVLSRGMDFCTQCGNRVEKNTNNGWGVGGILAGLVLCVIIVVFGLISSTGLTIRHMTGKEGIEKIIKKVDFEDMRTGFATGNGKRETLPEFLYDCVPYHHRDDIHMDEIEDLVNAPCMKEFMAEQASQYVTAAIRNNGDGIIEADEVVDFIEKNKDELEDILNCDISNSDIDEVEEYVEDYIEDYSELDKILEEYEDYEEYETYEEIINYISFFASYPFLIFCATVGILSIIAVWYINGWKSIGFSFTAVCFAILSAVQFIVMLAVSKLQPMLEDEIPIGDDTYDALFSGIRGHIGVTAFILLLLFVIMFMIAAKKNNKR